MTEKPKRIPSRKKARGDKEIFMDGKLRKTDGIKRLGITRKEFHAILDKASQPIKREAKSDLEKTET